MTNKRWSLLLVVTIVFLIVGCQTKTTTKIPKSQVPNTKGIPVLMYHKVNSDRSVGGLGLRVPEDQFDWQMKYLHDQGYHTISLLDLTNHLDKGQQLPDKPIVITFDDGYEDNLTKAYPILHKYNFTATIFIATDYVGNTNKWDIPNGQPVNTMLTWDEIKELDAKGIDIEAHTMSHPHLANISSEQLNRELTGSKSLLEDKLGKKIYFLAYPFGNYNKAVQDATKKAGYIGAVITDPQAKVDEKTDRLALSRVRIMGHYNNQTFINVLNNPKEGYKLYKERYEK